MRWPAKPIRTRSSSAGFWPGSGAIDYPAFYSYAYPEPPGYRATKVRPDAAFFSEALGEFILPYDAVRTADDPDKALLEFLQSTYEAAANAAKWDRDALECALGQPRRGAAGLTSILFARAALPSARATRVASRIAVQFARGAIAQRKGPAAPAQRRGDFGQRQRHHAEPALVGIIADAEIEMPHAIADAAPPWCVR